MPSNEILLYIVGGTCVLFVILVLIYSALYKKMGKSEYKQMQQLQKGLKASKYSREVLYQKLYIIYLKIPILKNYILKLRRRLEIIHLDDEYITRKDASKMLTKTLLIFIPLVLLTILISRYNVLLMGILLIFEIFLIDTIIDGMVDKKDNNLLKQQIEFFSEIRHAYHEYNMVEEAIYQTSQDDEMDVSVQGEKIYEILISDDPETELEKYYDVAPNSFLKEFAGISYLTKEFGDRKIDKASLYLKNINNITQEMQLEILKRDKLDYVFQSLAVISIVPILLLEPLKNWAISNFDFTQSFYNGKSGMIVQILILVITFIAYILIRRLKDNGSTAINTRSEHPWQEKVYKNPICKKIVDLFIPKKGTKEYRTVQQRLKDAALKLKMEWLYVNRITIAVITCAVSLILFAQLHRIAIDYVYSEPTSDYDIIRQFVRKRSIKSRRINKTR